MPSNRIDEKKVQGRLRVPKETAKTGGKHGHEIKSAESQRTSSNKSTEQKCNLGGNQAKNSRKRAQKLENQLVKHSQFNKISKESSRPAFQNKTKTSRAPAAVDHNLPNKKRLRPHGSGVNVKFVNSASPTSANPEMTAFSPKPKTPVMQNQSTPVMHNLVK